MAIRILYYTGLTACLLLIIACFMPWAYFADASIVNEADRTFTGFYSYKNSYGRPGKMLVATAIVAFVLMLLPKIWAKRTNLFICAIGVGYAVKTYILYVSCYNAYCPDKKAGIFLMLISSIIMLIAAVFPRIALKNMELTDNRIKAPEAAQ